ncbi:MAG: GLUG motif-containing protein, partial [Planctomycetota bacterium]
MSIKNHFRMSLAVSLFLLVAISVAHAQYSGGSGTADDPYQIARAEDLIALGETWRNLGEHYVLTADIDLDPNLAGRRVFDRAVIGHNWMPPFSGVFDGDGHTIAHLTIIAQGDHLGLFGVLAAGAEVRNLGLVDVNITGSGNSSSVGGLAGLNEGIVTTCHSTGAVEGNEEVGGLVGSNVGVLTASFSTGTVTGDSTAGGLVGSNWGGI